MVQAYLQVACCELNHLFIPTGVKLRQNSCILVLKCGDIFIACHLFLVCFFAYPYLSKLVVFRVYDTLTCYGAYDWCSFIGLLVASQQKMKLHKKFILRTWSSVAFKYVAVKTNKMNLHWLSSKKVFSSEVNIIFIGISICGLSLDNEEHFRSKKWLKPLIWNSYIISFACW